MHRLTCQVPDCHSQTVQRRFERSTVRWEGWETSRLDHWTVHAAPGSEPSDQGWKLHFSSIAEDAETVLTRVALLCRSRCWTFKHLADVDVLDRANGKDADRAGSGKFITVYPTEDSVDGELLDSLARDLSDCRGPRILSDLQWRGSVVHLRWGAFRLMETWDGTPAVRRPDGVLESDRRGVLFELPPWVPTPAWVDEERARRDVDANGSLASLSIEGAYSFSNAGGVYRASDEKLGAVVLKEGREHVARIDGLDAADRVEPEQRVLVQLSGSGVTPEPHRAFRAGGSGFLVTERVDGIPFNRAVMSKCPLTAAEPDPGALAAHASSVERAIGSVARALDEVHRRGVVHGDLAPRNVLVRADGSAALIDFESAVVAPYSARSGALATPGFAAPAALVGRQRDQFSLACLHLAALVPLTALFPLDPTIAGRVIDEAQRRYPTARLDRVRTQLEAALGPRAVQAPSPATSASTVRAALGRRLQESRAAIGGRSGRGVGLEHGADGVRLVLGRSSHATASAQTDQRPSRASTGLGLLSGYAGTVLLSADELDHRDFATAADQVERVDFRAGLAGIGTALLLVSEEPSQALLADPIAARLVGFSHDQDRARALPPGLLDGPSGIALLLAVHGRQRRNSESLDAARRLIEIDVDRLQETADAGLQLATGSRLLPFLGSGSAGVGVAIAELRRATGDSSFDEVLIGILRASCPQFTVHAGLLDGRAGLVHLAVDVAEFGLPGVDKSTVLAQFERHRAAFALHQLHLAEEPIFADRLLRDYDDGFGHGTAGVLSALEAMEDFEAGARSDRNRPSFLRRRSR